MEQAAAASSSSGGQRFVGNASAEYPGNANANPGTGRIIVNPPNAPLGTSFYVFAEGYMPQYEDYRGDYPYYLTHGTYGVPDKNSPHRGIDIGGIPEGTPIRTPVAGYVHKIVHDDMLGNRVVIKFRGKDGEDLYMHCCHLSSTLELEKGNLISTGQQIGIVGETGNAKGRHLHLEVTTQGS